MRASNAPDSRALRLKYILECTMGCPRTFEFRKQELELILEAESISDDVVCDHMLRSVTPGIGFLYEYLRQGHLAVRIGNTLFVHGAVTEASIGFVPDADLRFQRNEKVQGTHYDDVDTWIRHLNRFAQQVCM